MSNEKFRTITDFCLENPALYSFDLELYEQEIYNNLFKDNNIETVKTIGGGPNMDFFISQVDTPVKECVNIDINLKYRFLDIIPLQKKYKDYTKNHTKNTKVFKQKIQNLTTKITLKLQTELVKSQHHKFKFQT